MLVGGVLGQTARGFSVSSEIRIRECWRSGLEGHERGGFGGLEEGRLADLALDVAGLLVLFGAVSMRDTGEEGEGRRTHHLELRLGNLAVLLVAITLLLSLGALYHVSWHTRNLGGSQCLLRYPWLRFRRMMRRMSCLRLCFFWVRFLDAEG